MNRIALSALGAAVVVAASACGNGGHAASGSPTTPAASTPHTVATTRSPTRSSAEVASSGQWLGYHATLARTAAVPAVPALDPATRAWQAPLGAAVYGQVVSGDGLLFAATEQDRVVALSPATGAVLWSRTIGTPLTNVPGVAGCGDIDPLGITSTPALDPASKTLYVVGEVVTGGKVQHRLVALDAQTGAVRMSEAVDPPLPAGESPAQLLQRAGLALANGRVYVAYGGNDGDCGAYHGWVVGVAQVGAPDEVSFEVAGDGEGGAIWEAGGAPAVDAAGDVYVTTGNANPDPPQGGPDPKAYTESVVRLSPTLRPLAAFKDRIAGGDEDLATGNPVLLPGNAVFAVGKTDVGYVLSRSTLAERSAIHGLCGSDPDGGPAFDAARDVLFVPCKGGGIQEVDLADDSAGPLLPGSNGPPILVGNRLWSAGYGSTTLTEYDASTGRQLQRLDTGTDIPTFASPSVGSGLLLLGTREGVVTYR